MEEVKFSKELRGYSIAEVEKYINQMQEGYTKLETEKKNADVEYNQRRIALEETVRRLQAEPPQNQEQLSKDIQLLQKRNEDLNDVNIGASHKIKELEALNAGLTENIAKIQQEHKQQIEAMKQQLSAGNQGSETDKLQLEEEKSKIEAGMKKVEAEMNKVVAEMNKVEAEKKKVVAIKQEIDAERAKIDTEKTKTDNEKDTFDTEKKNVEAERQQLEKERQQLKTQRQSFEAEKAKQAESNAEETDLKIKQIEEQIKEQIEVQKEAYKIKCKEYDTALAEIASLSDQLELTQRKVEEMKIEKGEDGTDQSEYLSTIFVQAKQQADEYMQEISRKMEDEKEKTGDEIKDLLEDAYQEAERIKDLARREKLGELDVAKLKLDKERADMVSECDYIKMEAQAELESAGREAENILNQAKLKLQLAQEKEKLILARATERAKRVEGDMYHEYDRMQKYIKEASERLIEMYSFVSRLEQISSADEIRQYVEVGIEDKI